LVDIVQLLLQYFICINSQVLAKPDLFKHLCKLLHRRIPNPVSIFRIEAAWSAGSLPLVIAGIKPLVLRKKKYPSFSRLFTATQAYSIKLPVQPTLVWGKDCFFYP
jgi:hypothetical protein